MSALLSWVIIAIGVAVLFTLAVFVHEYGHFWVARRLGLKVDGFSIGFGPKIIGWQDRTGVVWALRWLPLGGFVKLPQMITSEAIEGGSDPSVPPASPVQKIAVALAGPAMNLVFALVLGSIVWWVGLPVPYNNTIIGYVPPKGVEAGFGIREGDRITAVNGKPVRNWEDIQRTAALSVTQVLSVTIQHGDGRTGTYDIPTEYSEAAHLKFLKLGPKDHPSVHAVTAGSAAERAGIRQGDEIISIDGIEIAGQQQLIELIRGRADQAIDLELIRDARTMRLKVTPVLDPKDKVARIGVLLGTSARMTYTVEKPGPTPFRQIGNTVSQMGELVRALFHKKESRVGVENLHGPVRIFTALATELRIDFRRALALMVVININLALLNLLPLPVLDGGHIVFSLIEMLTFRQIPARIHGTATLMFGFLLLSFMAFVFYNDVRGLSIFRSILKQENFVQAPGTNAPPVGASSTNR